MDANTRQSFMTALTTEHFVLQTAASATTAESSSRSSIYILALSSALVALGFVSQSTAAFWPFVASVFPAIVVLGALSIIRLVDITLEYQECLIGIARIHELYRTLCPEAEEHFATKYGRWPEASLAPSLQLGPMVGFLTTTSTMIAVINGMVAGAGIALLLFHMLGTSWMTVVVLVGVAVAMVLIVAFYLYQKWRFAKARIVASEGH
jgi:hypothetical protein